MKAGKLFVLSAPSGSGKSTILEHVISCNDNLEFSVSVTTRPKRENEIHGKDYFFVSKEEFENLISSKELLEWEEVYSGGFYGTLKPFIDEKLQAGKSIILDIDVKGALNVRDIYKHNCILVFIKVKDISTLRERLIKRNTDSIDKIEERLTKAEHELSFQNHFDFIVTNENIEDAREEVNKIFSTHLSKD